MAHPHPAAEQLVDHRHVGEVRVAVLRPGAQALQHVLVDLVDDLEVPRQQPLDEPDRPALERLGHQRVVGVVDGAAGDRPGLLPGVPVLVDEEPHQLRHRDRRVGVVELDRRLVGQRAQVGVVGEVAAQDVLQAGRGEEVLLLEPQLLAGLGGVVGVEDAADALREHLVLHRPHVVAAVEGLEVDQVAGLRRPQAQRVDPPPAPADHGRVVGDGQHALPALPGPGRPPVGAGARRLAHAPVEADRVDGLGALELPRVAEGQPVLRPLDLPALVQALLEQAVLVADAVAEAGDAERRHAVHQAGGEPPEAAVAQGRVRLDLQHPLRVDPEVGERRLGGVGEAQVVDRVAQEAADQELEREIVDPLAVALVDLPRRRHPAVDQPVADGQRQGHEPVVPGRVPRVLADRVDQLVEDGLAQALPVEAAGRGGEGGVEHGGLAGSGRSGRGRTLAETVAAARPGAGGGGRTVPVRDPKEYSR